MRCYELEVWVMEKGNFCIMCMMRHDRIKIRMAWCGKDISQFQEREFKTGYGPLSLSSL